MPLMGKESGGSHKQPPIAIAGGSGVVDVANGSRGAEKRHDPQNHRGGCGDELRHDVGRIHEWASVGAGRHVDETEITHGKNSEIDVLESHDNGDRRISRRGVSNPKIKTKRSNQLLDKEGLFAKAMKDFTAQQWQREEAAAGRETSVGGRIQPTTTRHETLRRRKRGFLLFSWCNHAPCKRKEAGTMLSATKGAASPWFDGEGSKNLLMRK